MSTQHSLYETMNTWWFFSNTDTRRYNNPLLRGIDWLGRRLSFLNVEDYESLSRKTSQPLRLGTRLKLIAWTGGLGFILGSIGALFRWTASKLGGKKYTADDYDKAYLHIHNKDGKKIIPDNLIRDLPNSLSILSLNVALFPTYLQFINRKFLKPNKERIPKQIEKIKKLNKDVIVLQEAFSPDAQAQYMEELKTIYPYHVSSIGKGFEHGFMSLKKPLGFIVGSGLMLLSKFPIVEAEFEHYTDTAIGEETAGAKGFLGVKLLLSDNRFSTVYTTHTQSGGMWPFRNWQEKHFGRTFEIRGKELKKLEMHRREWASIPPPSFPDLRHVSTHIAGDINTAVNNEQVMLSQCVYTHPNPNVKPYRKGDVVSPGKDIFFQNMIRKPAENFVDIRPDFLIDPSVPVPDEYQIELYSSLENYQARQKDPLTAAKPNKLQLLVEDGVIQGFKGKLKENKAFGIWSTVDIRKLLKAEANNQRILEAQTVDERALQFSGSGPKDDELITVNNNPSLKLPCISRMFNTRVMDCNVIARDMDPKLTEADIQSHLITFDNASDHFAVCTELNLSPLKM